MANNIEEIKASIAGKITLATSQMLNSTEQPEATMKFLNSIINLFESVNNNTLNVSDATKRIEEINSTLNDIKKETSIAEVSQPKHIEPAISKEIKEKQENKIEWENIDYAAYVYGNAGGNSYFTSTPNLNIRNNESSHRNLASYFWSSAEAISIYCSYDEYKQMYELQYAPQNEFGPSKKYGIHKGAMRGSDRPVNNLYLRLPINKFRKLALTEDTKICLEDGENLRDAIDNIIFEQRKGYSESLPKIKIPFYQNNKEPNEFDIEFANILLDYYSKTKKFCDIEEKQKKQVSQETGIASMHLFLGVLATNFRNILVINNSANDLGRLNLPDTISLVNIFDTTTQKPRFFVGLKKGRAQASDFNEINIYSMSSKEQLDIEYNEKEIITLDIKDGLSSEENIKTLYNYICQNKNTKKIIEQVRLAKEYVDRYEEKSEKLREKYKKIYEHKTEMFGIYDQLVGSLLTRLADLYERKFGEEMSLNGEEFGTRSGSGRGGRH